MDDNVKWKKYLWLSLFLFLAFFLEYFSIFVIEMLILHMDIWNYTADQRSIHHLIMVSIWIVYLSFIVFYSREHYDFPSKKERTSISAKNWFVTVGCLAACKVMTFIDWHTLKVVGELQGKSIFQFIAQYMYYVVEVGIVLLIIIFGQRAFDVRMKKESAFPFGGIVLAVTWGIFHFVSRGVGIEVWNGISCMIFSILNGIMYLELDKNFVYSYIFIAIGYLL
ncbi:hypothetical protein NE683_15565 [Bariatricus massiliensis]|uniref:CPBP family intramembrane metalloprotease n=1 Tax=Bariatricus massiliensis TaxID=1745713 RepID=A0ABS8DIC0_9FIRM|nr:hypothetical protein [Bariatricus massiliensis]MCB7305062.1 hypothetical protein [Bariatricus massiliensis]MCB7375597.1 hypothetical protein [Bariatricus massiliensis]MCB7388186.1 hypothetical protein [Bariatricus massiliensis]MCB7412378.1 hypothetical protein [Bariatricus massiliensis]MCQ5254640.1 hypothetical protein [Bariatricus massiliensis]